MFTEQWALLTPLVSHERLSSLTRSCDLQRKNQIFLQLPEMTRGLKYKCCLMTVDLIID